MKKTLILLLLLPLMYTTACSSDDDNNGTESSIDPTLYNGRWLLKNVSGSIAGISNDFTTIAWDFDTNAHTITVHNTNTDDTVEDFFGNGTYDYDFVTNEISPNTCSETIEVENINFGCLALSDRNQKLVLTQTESDGYTLTFERMVIIE